MDISTISTSLPCDIPSSDVKILEGHTSEVWAYPASCISLPFLIGCLVYPELVSQLPTGFCLCMESIRFAACIWVSLLS